MRYINVAEWEIVCNIDVTVSRCSLGIIAEVFVVFARRLENRRPNSSEFQWWG